MARRTGNEPLYEAFRIFRERCLEQDQSLLWPEMRIWTLPNLELWKTRVIDKPSIGAEMNFNEKLLAQLDGAPSALWGLVADLHYVYYLPSVNITFQTRKQNISWAAQHAGLTLPPDEDPIWVAHQDGFTRTSMKYHFRYAQFHLLVLFALRLKEKGEISQTLADSGRVQTLLDEVLESIPVKSDRAYDMRHAILYMMFPDRYERMISTRDKERIVDKYGKHVSDSGADLDAKLHQVREGLSKQYGKDFDFYTHLKDEWRPDKPPEPIINDEIEEIKIPSIDNQIVTDALRLLARFKNLILYGPPGTGKTYWAKEIANQLVAPQLQQVQSKTAFLQTVIEELPFYDTLALQMYTRNPDEKYTVPQLEVMELVQARFRQYPVKFPTNQIWGYLQAHTSPESQTVKISSRAEPFLFDKTTGSQWFLTSSGKEYILATLNDRLKLIKQGPPATNQPEDFIRWITFHQSYAYEDFVEGLRPKTEQDDSGVLSFEIKSGIFRSLCARAQEDSGNQYVLVIDEINRGNIAKVFGELMTLIEADKRGKLSVELPYSKEQFKVPANLNIIGTMNTTDRSIALLDVALRRRFAFLELHPKLELLEPILITITEEDPLDLGSCLKVLNQRIAELRGVDYQIGHSYFMPLLGITGDDKKLAYLDDIWNYQVLPLLKEYFYSQTDLLRQVLPPFFVDIDQGTPATGPLILNGEELVSALNKLK